MSGKERLKVRKYYPVKEILKNKYNDNRVAFRQIDMWMLGMSFRRITTALPHFFQYTVQLIYMRLLVAAMTAQPWCRFTS